jgi:probable HAF family extracellular repeat protein
MRGAQHRRRDCWSVSAKPAAFGALVLLITIVGARPAAAQSYTVTELGTLGGTDSDAYALSAAGHVVGAARLPGDWAIHAYLWHDGAMRDLGTLGGTWSYAHSVNAAGQVVGESTLSDDQYFRPFLWQNGTLRDLGTLGGRQGAAEAINSKGQIAGGSTLPGEPQWPPDRVDGRSAPVLHAFLYDGRGMRDLGTLGGAFSFAYGVNDAGQVVGTASLASVLCLADYRYRGDRRHGPLPWAAPGVSAAADLSRKPRRPHEGEKHSMSPA